MCEPAISQNQYRGIDWFEPAVITVVNVYRTGVSCDVLGKLELPLTDLGRE